MTAGELRACTWSRGRLATALSILRIPVAVIKEFLGDGADVLGVQLAFGWLSARTRCRIDYYSPDNPAKRPPARRRSSHPIGRPASRLEAGALIRPLYPSTSNILLHKLPDCELQMQKL